MAQGKMRMMGSPGWSSEVLARGAPLIQWQLLDLVISKVACAPHQIEHVCPYPWLLYLLGRFKFVVSLLRIAFLFLNQDNEQVDVQYHGYFWI